MEKRENKKSQTERMIWIRSTSIDCFLDKAAEMEILRYFARKGYDVYLFAGISEKKFRIVDSLRKYPNIHFIFVPLRYIPIITPLLIGLAAFIFLPFFICVRRLNFVIMEPGFPIISSLWKFILKPLKYRDVLDIRSTPLWRDTRRILGFRGDLQIVIFKISVMLAKKLFDGMTILTPLMKKEVSDTFRIDPKFIGVWTMGVSTDLFKQDDYDSMNMRKKLNLTNKFIVFYHGSFSFYRGLIESIESIEIVKNNCENVVLFLLGDGPSLSALKELIQKNGLQNNVIIHDPVDYVDVPNYIAMCDIGIVPLPDLPDWRYQCPQKLLEYLAMEKVVIATDIPAHREVLGNNKCGIYISSSNPNEIAEAIMHAFNNKEKLKDWGSAGRVIVEERYSWEKVGREFENYLIQLS